MKKNIFLLLFATIFLQNYTAKIFADSIETYNILFKDNISEDIGIERLKKYEVDVVDSIPEINLVTVNNCSSLENLITENQGIIDSVSVNHDINLKQNITYLYLGEVYSDNNNDFWSKQWDMQKSISTGKKFSHKSNGNSTIGVIDSGISGELINNMSNIQSAENFIPNQETGIINKTDVIDNTGHGTSVVGQISSSGLYLGIAPQMNIRVYKVLDGETAQSSGVIKAIIQAAKDDVDVINISLGEYLLDSPSDVNSQSSLIKIYQRAVNYAKKQGSVIVASVGNEGFDLTNQEQLKTQLNSLNGSYGVVKDIPGQLENVVTVGAVDDNDSISDFSNYGTGEVDIYATGGSRRRLDSEGYSSWISNRLYENDLVLIPTLEGKYTYGYGTSIAAPKVSAALGLIIEKYHLKDKPDEAIRILYDNALTSYQESGELIKLLNITNFVN